MTAGIIAALIEGGALIATAIIRKVKSEEDD